MVARGLTAIAFFCEVLNTDTASFLILFVLRSPVFGFLQKFLKPFDSKLFLFFSKTCTLCWVYLASRHNHVLQNFLLNVALLTVFEECNCWSETEKYAYSQKPKKQVFCVVYRFSLHFADKSELLNFDLIALVLFAKSGISLERVKRVLVHF